MELEKALCHSTSFVRFAMRARTRASLAAALAALVIAACGGSGTGPDGGTPPPPPPPPPVEVLTVTVSAPSTVTQSYDVYPMASVAIEVKASSTTNSPITLTCAVDGKAKDSCASAMLPLGTHTILVSGNSAAGGVAKDSVVVTVLPAKISGRVIVPTATGEYVPQGAYVVVGTSGAEDSVKVASDGTFSLNTRYAAASSARIVIRNDPNMIPSVLSYSSAYFGNLVVIGVPKMFTITSGGFAGRVVPIDPVRAAEPSPPPSAWSFFYTNVTSDGGYRYTVGSWKSYPQCVAFAGVSATGSSEAITSADSAAFWKHLDSLERAFGKDLAKPCLEDETKANGGVIVSLKTTATINSGGVSVGSFGDYSRGVMIMRDHLSFNLMFSVQHEFSHAFFSVGHTCVWDSIMQSSCPRYVPNQISVEDVAYNLLQIRLRELERKYSTRFSLAPAVNGARLQQNLPEQKLIIVDENGRLIQ